MWLRAALSRPGQIQGLLRLALRTIASLRSAVNNSAVATPPLVLVLTLLRRLGIWCQCACRRCVSNFATCITSVNELRTFGTRIRSALASRYIFALPAIETVANDVLVGHVLRPKLFCLWRWLASRRRLPLVLTPRCLRTSFGPRRLRRMSRWNVGRDSVVFDRICNRGIVLDVVRQWLDLQDHLARLPYIVLRPPMSRIRRPHRHVKRVIPRGVWVECGIVELHRAPTSSGAELSDSLVVRSELKPLDVWDHLMPLPIFLLVPVRVAALVLVVQRLDHLEVCGKTWWKQDLSHDAHASPQPETSLPVMEVRRASAFVLV